MRPDSVILVGTVPSCGHRSKPYRQPLDVAWDFWTFVRDLPKTVALFLSLQLVPVIFSTMQFIFLQPSRDSSGTGLTCFEPQLPCVRSL